MEYLMAINNKSSVKQSCEKSFPEKFTIRSTWLFTLEERLRMLLPPLSSSILQERVSAAPIPGRYLYLPLTQPASSLLSGQSWTLLHCFAPWMQVPSPHWNSSGLQVTKAWKQSIKENCKLLCLLILGYNYYSEHFWKFWKLVFFFLRDIFCNYYPSYRFLFLMHIFHSFSKELSVA